MIMKNKRLLLITLLIVITGSIVLYLNCNPKGHNLNNNHVNTETEQVNVNLEYDQKQPANSDIASSENQDQDNKCAITNLKQATKIKTENLNQAYKYPDTGQKYIFFDVGQVLLSNSSTGAAKAVGVSHMFWYTVKHKKTPESKDIQARLFDFIDYCTKRPRGHALFNDQPLPGLMCDWAKGKIATSEILKIVTHYEQEAKAFFISEQEKNLVFGALNLFKADVICNIQRPVAKMIELFEQACQQFPGHVYILSNWDRESAALVRKKFPQIFKLIPQENIFFSGDIGELKPEKAMFEYVTNKLKINPKNCILIDDNIENIKVAKSLGWIGLAHKNPERTIRKFKRLTKS